MNRQDIYKYIKDKYNTEPKYCWKKFPLYAVFNHTNNKWFGIIMNIEKNKIGLEGNDEIDILDIKCPSEIIGSLRKKRGFLPAYHMNKEHWITIVLDESVKSSEIKELIDLSYELTNK